MTVWGVVKTILAIAAAAGLIYGLIKLADLIDDYESWQDDE